MNINEYTNLILIMRQTARKYTIKVFELNCIYIAYLINKKDFSLYVTRTTLGMSVAQSYRSTNISRLTSHDLIKKINFDVYLFTPLAIEVLNYIDSQLSNLESK